jgi:hypothetical protein
MTVNHFFAHPAMSVSGLGSPELPCFPTALHHIWQRSSGFESLDDYEFHVLSTVPGLPMGRCPTITPTFNIGELDLLGLLNFVGKDA